MKHRFSVLRYKWQVPFHLGCAFLPAALLLGAYAIPEIPYLACNVALIYLVFMLVCTLVPGKTRLPLGIAGLACIIAAGVDLILRYKSPALIFPPILFGWLVLETLPLFGRDSREEMPPHVFVLGAVLHLTGQAALFIAGRSENNAFAPVEPGLSAAFAVFFLLTLMNLNRTNLIYGAAMEKTVPRHIYRYNRVLTLVLVAVTLFFGCMPAVVRFISWLWNTFIGLIADLIAWFHSLFPVEEHIPDNGPGSGGDPLFAYAESEPGLFAKILEVVLYLIVIATVVLILWMVIRYVRRFVKWLWKRFKEYAAAANTGDYIDEITDTRQDGDRNRIFGRLKRKHDPLRGVNERKLAPAARIRFCYLRLLVRRKDWLASRTARENLPAEAAVLYERARYSRHEITEADAKRFRELTAGIEKN